MKKVLLWLGVLVVLAVVALVVVQKVMVPKYSAAWLVGELESAFPLRAHVGGVEVDVTSTPAVLRVEDILLVPRDQVADAGTPFAERKRPELGSTGLACTEAVIEANLTELLAKRINVSGIVARGVLVKTVVGKGGKSSVNDLFESEDEEAAGAEETAPVEEGGDETEPFNVRDLPLPATLGRVAVEDGRIECLLEKPNAYLRLEDLNAALKGLDVDADDLASHNRATLEGSARLTLKNKAGDLKFMELLLGAGGEVIPFEPSTGNLNPDTVYEFSLKQGSTIDVLPMIDELSKNLDLLKGAGVDVSRLKLRGELKNDVPVRLRFFDGKVHGADELSLGFKEYSLTMAQGSWIQTSDSTHEITGRLAGSEELTNDVTKAIDDYLGKQAGATVASIARGLVVDPMLVDGQLMIEYRSSGKLGSPKVRAETPVKGLEEALKEALKGGAVQDLLKGFTDKLFGK